jgi:hypothetical protein
MTYLNGNGNGGASAVYYVTGRNIAHGKRSKAERLALGVDLARGRAVMIKPCAKRIAQLLGIPVLELRNARRRVEKAKALKRAKPAPVSTPTFNAFGDWWHRSAPVERARFVLDHISHIDG